jgi:hypothetical protein
VDEKQGVKPKGNGCGPSWLPSWAWPDFGYTEECNEHDQGYAEGGSARSRFSTDSSFFEAMNRNAAKRKHPLAKAGAGAWAGLNHLLVRVGGWASFQYRKAKE